MDLRPLPIGQLLAAILLAWWTAVTALAEGGFVSISPLTARRHDHTATLLPNGKVLVVGGTTEAGAFLAAVEMYNPSSGKWELAGVLNTGRRSHTATLLLNGKVLVVGGYNGAALNSTEIFDPQTGSWTAGPPLAQGRYVYTATLLANGKVLVAGGFNGGAVGTCEIFDPATGQWTSTGPLETARHYHAATLLADGKVLVTGGQNNAGEISSAELYNPDTGLWTETNPMITARYYHSAILLPNGKVLAAGGVNSFAVLKSSEIYDPLSGLWTTKGDVGTGRFLATASLAPDGRAMIIGGYGDNGPLDSIETYETSSGEWISATTFHLVTPRRFHTTTMLAGGSLMVAGGEGAGPSSLSQVEIYDFTRSSASPTSPLIFPRLRHTATRLHDGRVLVVGGWVQPWGETGTTEIYDPSTGNWSLANPLSQGRMLHRATLLPDGRVLVIGGISGGGQQTSVEVFNPETGTWTLTSPVSGDYNETAFTATLLQDGRVLLEGDRFRDGIRAEIYDPAKGVWTPTGYPFYKRAGHNATRLLDGKVLVTGGRTDGASELYDPISGNWSATGSSQATTPPLGVPSLFSAAALLPDGTVLLVAGTSSEIYDPISATWSAPRPLSASHGYCNLTLLPNGKVLLSGTADVPAELYDPATGSWTSMNAPTMSLDDCTATLLTNGNVLFAGGFEKDGTPSTQLYSVSLPGSEAWRPRLISASFDSIGRLVLTGSGFRGVSSASGGNGAQNSPSDHPIVQLRQLGNDQVTYLEADPSVGFSATALTSLPVPRFTGDAWVTVFVNGVPSPPTFVGYPDITAFKSTLPTGETFDLVLAPGTSSDLILTIRNIGALPLSGISISKDGPDSADFTIFASPATSLNPIETTTCTIRFAPTTAGPKTAIIHIASNVPGKSPLDINLTGLALSFTADTDGDSVNDASEYLLNSLGFNWKVSQPGLVQALRTNATSVGLYTQEQYDANRVAGRTDVIASPSAYNLYTVQQFDANRIAGRTDVTTSPSTYSLFTLQQFDANRTAGQTDVTSAPNTFGLYTLNQIQALNVGSPLITKGLAGDFQLTIAVQKAPAVNSPFVDFPFNTPGASAQVNTEGKLEFHFTVPDDAAFFRLESR